MKHSKNIIFTGRKLKRLAHHEISDTSTFQQIFQAKPRMGKPVRQRVFISIKFEFSTTTQYSENHLSQPTEYYHQVNLLTLNCKEDWIENGVIKAIRVMKH